MQDNIPFFKIPEPLFLAPMASLTHRAFRTFLGDFGGCDYYFTEMASVGSIRSGAPFERFYIDPEPFPERTIIQLVGNDEDEFSAVAAELDSGDAYGIDINMGCSAPEIVRQNAGISWMKDLERARSLAGKVRRSLRNKRLSVKLRTGWNDDPEYLIRFCLALQDEGVEFITLHPRLKAQKLTRPPKWENFDLLKRALRIPLIANGDVTTPRDAERLFADHGADGVMLGRAAVTVPWIFRVIKETREGNRKPFTVDMEETANRFIDFLEILEPDEFQESRLRRFFMYYCDSLPFGHHLKMETRQLSRGNEFRDALKRFFDRQPEAKTKII